MALGQATVDDIVTRTIRWTLSGIPPHLGGKAGGDLFLSRVVRAFIVDWMVTAPPRGPCSRQRNDSGSATDL